MSYGYRCSTDIFIPEQPTIRIRGFPVSGHYALSARFGEGRLGIQHDVESGRCEIILHFRNVDDAGRFAEDLYAECRRHGYGVGECQIHGTYDSSYPFCPTCLEDSEKTTSEELNR